MSEQPRTFSSTAEAGQYIKSLNPAITLDDTVAGEAASRKFGWVIKPPTTQSFLQRLGTGAADVMDQSIGPNSPFGMANRGFMQGATFGGSEKLLQGASSGLAKLGLASGQEYSQDPRSTMMGQAGNFVGELVVPYRWAYRLLSPALKTGAAMAAPQLSRIGLAGAAAGTVEGTKAAVEGENPFPSFATGFIMGAVPEAALRGVGVLAQKGVERLLKPAPGEIDLAAKALLEKHGLPVIPTDVRPGNITEYAEGKVAHSAAAQQILRNLREQVGTKLQGLRDELVMVLGDNAAALAPTQAGANIAQSLENTTLALKEGGNKAYQELAATEVGNLPIDPWRKVTRVMPDGSQIETDLLGGFRKILGDRVIDEPSAADSPAQKRLRTIYLELKKAQKIVTTERVSGIPTELDPSDPGYYMKRHPFTRPPAIMQPQGPGEPNIFPMPNMVVNPVEEVPLRNYNWWVGKTRAVGGMLEQKSVRDEPKDYALVSKLYHHLRDVVDAQAMEVSPNYETLVKNARAQWVAYRVFDENPLVRQVATQVEKDPEKVVDVLFKNVTNVRAFKKIASPEAFNSARQAWLRDLTWDAVRQDPEIGMAYVSGKSIWSKLAKFTEGPDSEFMKEVFSDAGFQTPTGEALPASTDAAAKMQSFNELLKLSLKMDKGLQVLKGGREQLGAGQERATPGTLLEDLAQGGNRTRSLLANLMLMKMGAESYFAPPAKNIFLGAKLPALAGMDIPLPFTDKRIPGPIRSSVTSAVLNRLLPGQALRSNFQP